MYILTRRRYQRTRQIYIIVTKVRRGVEIMERRVRVQQGILEGEDCGDYIVFRGIPYAKPPVGSLRWKAPQEPECWEGVLRADRFRAAAVQDFPDRENPFTGRYAKEFYDDPDFMREISEDCLYLNIWVPGGSREEKLPVAFWIHGGGFSGGFSSEVEFDGAAYCEKGVILVTVEYRVNIFGFLAHPWLDAENERGISGNYGILDQIAALRWVRENIGAFGGDREKITVFGQSAGSMSTQVLVSSPLTKGMIAGAILQSGISCREDILATPTLMEEEEYGRQFVEITGAQTIEELRNMTTEQLHEAFRKFDAKMWKEGRGLILVPNVDGYVLHRSVKEVWERGEMRNIPYMLGAVTDDLGAEQSLVKAKKPGILIEECKRWSRQCERVYGRPSWLYFFTHELPGDDWGAFHSAELWYMFGTYGRCWRPMDDIDAELSAAMTDYWTQFIKTGNPNGTGEAGWKAYTERDPFVKEFS